jgi:dihydroorotase
LLRNILLAEMTARAVHCQAYQHCGKPKLLREAKRRSVPVSGEACHTISHQTDVAIAGSEKFWKTDGKELFAGVSQHPGPPTTRISK